MKWNKEEHQKAVNQVIENFCKGEKETTNALDFAKELCIEHLMREPDPVKAMEYSFTLQQLPITFLVLVVVVSYQMGYFEGQRVLMEETFKN